MRNDEREGNEEAGFVVGSRGDIASPKDRRGAGCAGGPSPLSIKADPVSVAVGKPVTFTIGKTNVLPSDLEWIFRDHLPASMEFASATLSQGTCALLECSNTVQCGLGILSYGDEVPSSSPLHRQCRER